jgi:hypothetical protein
MAFGSAFHKYLELVKDNKDPQPAITEYNYRGREHKFHVKCLETLCQGYVEKYNDDWEVVANEKIVEIPFENTSFVVKLDTIVNWHQNYLSVEHKTTSNLGEMYFDKYILNGQIDAQCYAIRQEYGKCGGVFIDACEYKHLKTKPRKDKNGNTKYDKVVPWLEGTFVASYCRDLFNRTDKELDNWYANTSHWLDNIMTDKVFPKATSSVGGYTCQKCQYNRLCKHEDDEEVLTEYEKVDPYAYLKENN